MGDPLKPHTVECTHCGVKFEALRPEALFCSTRCRVAAHRAKRKPPVTADSNGNATIAALRAELETLRRELADAPVGPMP